MNVKKCRAIVFAVLAMGLAASAQDNHPPAVRRFGFKVGVNVSNMNFNKGVPAPPVPVKTNWRPGIFFGFLLNLPVTKNLGIQPEYLYVQSGGKIAASGVSYQLDYVSLPVLLRYQFSPVLSIVAGPQFDLLLHAKKDSSGVSNNITHDTEERNFGLAAGFEIQVFKMLGLNARFVHGLNHVGIGQRSDVREFKFELIQVSVSLRF